VKLCCKRHAGWQGGYEVTTGSGDDGLSDGVKSTIIILSARPDSLSGSVGEFHPFQCCTGCLLQGPLDAWELFLINLCSPVDLHLSVSMYELDPMHPIFLLRVLSTSIAWSIVIIGEHLFIPSSNLPSIYTTLIILQSLPGSTYRWITGWLGETWPSRDWSILRATRMELSMLITYIQMRLQRLELVELHSGYPKKPSTPEPFLSRPHHTVRTSTDHFLIHRQRYSPNSTFSIRPIRNLFSSLQFPCSQRTVLGASHDSLSVCCVYDPQDRTIMFMKSLAGLYRLRVLCQNGW